MASSSLRSNVCVSPCMTSLAMKLNNQAPAATAASASNTESSWLPSQPKKRATGPRDALATARLQTHHDPRDRRSRVRSRNAQRVFPHGGEPPAFFQQRSNLEPQRKQI